MKQVLIAALLIVSSVVPAQKWEWISNQVDVENNADPNKAVVYDLWKHMMTLRHASLNGMRRID